ncbi:hypothetical protein VIBHAR_06277 [Vibrio campbellii ATCC BAA-1116]|uniref:N-acetyltransferase domain-containing protein n=1 Tax=Vibrio campbellii (strain ATCC BAA-1116) TaxID=2902295 RepID=A7N1Z4_VIBC1|nr:hypothetical protein VIBHAR_06277 [Vibrio campbellii ATCC BAA-1116]
MKLEFKLNPEQNDLDLIRDGIRAYNRMHLPDGDVDAVGCFARNDEGKIVGGLTGEMFNNTVFVEYLWVDAEARTSGVGRKQADCFTRRASKATRGDNSYHLTCLERTG